MRETHGKTGTALYARWKTIKRRCTKPKATGYANYGGRGITMYELWIESFNAFYAYMGDPPTPKHTIERIDNDKGYEPENVRWASYSDQIFNQRERKHKYGYAGVRKTKDTYWAMITINGKRNYLGSFRTAELASQAYELAKEQHIVQIKRLSN